MLLDIFTASLKITIKIKKIQGSKHRLSTKKKKIKAPLNRSQCATAVLELSSVNLPCTYELSFSPSACLLPAVDPPLPHLFSQPLDQFCTRAAKPPSRVPLSNFSVLQGTDREESPLLSDLKDTVSGVMYSSSLPLPCICYSSFLLAMTC